LNFTLADERGNWARLVTRLAEAGLEIEAATLITNDDQSVSAHVLVSDPKTDGASALVKDLNSDGGQNLRTLQFGITTGREGLIGSTNRLAEISNELAQLDLNVYSLVYTANAETGGSLSVTIAPKADRAGTKLDGIIAPRAARSGANLASTVASKVA
jgi:hypothetical protein